jgi:mannitol-1-phosphate 5-dehydrogenase
MALSNKHGIELAVLETYAGKIRKRFKNQFLKDDVARVGADPLRKLSNNDRLVSPLKLCRELDLSYEGIVRGIAAGYRFDPEGDRKARLVRNIIRETGIEKAVDMVSGIPVDDPLNQVIADAYRAMAKGD